MKQISLIIVVFLFITFACNNQKEKINGMYPPATLSKELLTGLLKGEMGFKGVLVSDAMVMGGFRGWYDSYL